MSLQVIKNGRERRGGKERRDEEKSRGRGNIRKGKNKKCKVEKRQGKNRIIEQGMGKKWNKKAREKK